MTFSSSALFQLANEVSAFLFFQQLQIKKVQLWNTKDSTHLMNELSFHQMEVQSYFYEYLFSFIFHMAHFIISKVLFYSLHRNY